jgi:putative addiction module component (TIGR02574 family)
LSFPAHAGGSARTLAITKGPKARGVYWRMSTIDIAKLSAKERLELLEQLWDSLSPEAIPMTDAQKEELDRRLDELDREGPVGIPWNEVLDRIRNRKL